VRGQKTFSVQDTGIGIPEKDINRVFDRFEQVESSLSRETTGTGLGLTISKEFIEFMDGKILVKSRVGYGSTFSFHIPLGLNTPCTLAEPAAPETPAPVMNPPQLKSA